MDDDKKNRLKSGRLIITVGIAAWTILQLINTSKETFEDIGQTIMELVGIAVGIAIVVLIIKGISVSSTNESSEESLSKIANSKRTNHKSVSAKYLAITSLIVIALFVSVTLAVTNLSNSHHLNFWVGLTATVILSITIWLYYRKRLP